MRAGNKCMFDVIICDDELVLRNGLKALIERSGLPLRVAGVAANGVEALKLIREKRPFIVLMDINMPGLSGLDVVEETKKLGLKVRFIIVTGHDEFQYARRACHLNVADYLLKPVNREELMALLKKLLKQIREEQLTQRILVSEEKTQEQKILFYIQQHFTEQNFSLGELSDTFCLSQSYLTRLVKQETGKSFTELITQLRVERAISLLMQYPDMKLVEIAERTGFASQHYFSRVFKEKTGFPPADYREHMRGAIE